MEKYSMGIDLLRIEMILYFEIMEILSQYFTG